MENRILKFNCWSFKLLFKIINVYMLIFRCYSFKCMKYSMNGRIEFMRLKDASQKDIYIYN